MKQHTDCDSKTDEELVGLTLEDTSYFACLVNRYTAPLLRYIRRITNISLDDAEDILQNIFIKVYENINSFDVKLKFSSWIYRITHNQVISEHRKLKARPEGNHIDVDDNIFNTIVSDVDIMIDIDREYLRTHMNRGLSNIDVKYREVLILRFFEEKNYQEISDILRIPEGTVATRINRAKQQLGKQLNKYYEQI
jgi:RNA polymerase sigma-70 factor, ECF subfamily